MSNAEKIFEKLKEAGRIFDEIDEITPIEIEMTLSTSEDLYEGIISELEKESPEDRLKYEDKAKSGKRKIKINHDPKLDRKLESTI